MSAKGELRDEPLPRLVHRLYRERLTGTLSIFGPPGRATLLFRDGMPVHVSGPEATSRLGQVLVQLGLLEERTLEAVLRVQLTAGKRLGEVLIEIGKLNEAAVGKGLRQQLFLNGCRLLARRSGSFEIEVAEHDRGLDPAGRAAQIHPARLIYHGLRDGWDQEGLTELLADLEAKAVRIPAAEVTCLDDFGFATEDRQAVELLTKGYWTVADLAAGCDAGPLSALRVVAALGTLDLLDAQHKEKVPRLRRKARPGAGTGAPPGRALELPPTLHELPSAAAATISGVTASAEKAVVDKARDVDQQTLYQVLEVPDNATRAGIKTAYFTLAKVYHPDRAMSLGRPSLRPELERIFSRLSEAYATLSDDAKRNAYDQQLRSQGGRAPADEGQRAQLALDAEVAFQKGEILFKRKDYAAALEELRAAVEKNPDEGEHLALLAWVEFVRPGASADAQATREQLRRAIELSPKCARAHQYMGMLLRTDGDVEGAIASFRKALQLQPYNTEVQSELRVLEMRRSRAAVEKKTSGFLDRFRKK